MPRFPDTSQKLSGIKGAVFEKFRDKMKDFGADLIRLHIGDTYMSPVYPLPLSLSFVNDNQSMSRYGTYWFFTISSDLRECKT